jgi:heme a synthase
MSSPSVVPSAGLRRFAVLTAIATLCLVVVGGLVTSHGAGMAVPDWPNTNGYNMFFFPFSQWVGGIFYEHTHRLVASVVGVLTTLLALWLHGRKSRPLMRWAGVALFICALAWCVIAPRRWTDSLVLGATGTLLFGASFVWPRCPPVVKWLRCLGLAAFFAVVVQGVLGGLRVVLLKDAIGIFHATLAQLFFVLVCAIALFTSNWWQMRAASPGGGVVPERASLDRLRWLFIATSVLILGQLILGAAMRHQHAGLAIPDFPLAYGKLWPATDPASVAAYNQRRLEVLSVNPITGFQIVLQMIHRITALLILCAVAYCAWSTRRTLPRKNILRPAALFWLGLILTQVLLGAATIWSDKAADIATAHVLVGALSLASGVIMSIISSHELVLTNRVTDSPLATGAQAELLPEPRPSFGISSHAI